MILNIIRPVLTKSRIRKNKEQDIKKYRELTRTSKPLTVTQKAQQLKGSKKVRLFIVWGTITLVILVLMIASSLSV
jgi:hypothetical protein